MLNKPIMKMVRYDKPPLSFNPTVLFIEKQDAVYYKIYADGFEVGVIITRNNEWDVKIEPHELTDQDREFFINAAKAL